MAELWWSGEELYGEEKVERPLVAGSVWPAKEGRRRSKGRGAGLFFGGEGPVFLWGSLLLQGRWRASFSGSGTKQNSKPKGSGVAACL